jgi:hypothetical protein
MRVISTLDNSERRVAIKKIGEDYVLTDDLGRVIDAWSMSFFRLLEATPEELAKLTESGYNIPPANN